MTETFRTSRWFVCTMVASLLVGISSGAEFAGGTGEPNDPYQVATAEQLIGIGPDPNLLDKHFVLVSDIDLDPNLPGGRVFDGPVIAMVSSRAGMVDPHFTGTVDGHGFKVYNLVILAQTDSTLALGLFGQIGKDARVRNLAVDNVRIQGDARSAATGALAGINWGLVEACYATGTITGVGKIGGLCGQNIGEIRSCYAAVSVSGQQFVGGLIGFNDGVYQRPSRRDIAVNAMNEGQVANCYATGAVSALENAGGLIGGGAGLIQGCFWDIETSGCKTSAAGTGLPTFQMMETIVFATSGWDQDSNWVIDDGRDYPRLAWEGTAGQPIRGRASDRFEGEGTPQDPYHIVTVEQFALIGIVPSLWDKHFVLDADLDLAGVLLRPIGAASWQAFNGFLHGNRHVLRHFTLEIDEHVPVPAGYESHGLFGYVGPGGRISRLGLEDVAIVVNAGSHTIGTLAAVNEGVITGCYATGVVDARQSQSTVGLIGHNSGVLARSYTQVEVTGPNWIGGLVGRNDLLSGSAPDSLPARTTYSGLVLECYATRSMPEDNATGGLTGRNYALVLDSYFLREPKEVPPGGVARRPPPPTSYGPPVGIPLTDSQMRQQSSFAGWDFAGSSSDGSVDRWHMLDGDYPVLSWQADWQDSCPVPDIADLPLDWARAEIESAGFIVGEVLYDYHSAIPKDRTIVSAPVGIAPLGSTVNVIVSQGVYTLPNPTFYKSTVTAPSLIELEAPGQIECLAGRISGGGVILLTRDIDMSGWDVLPAPVPSSMVLPAGGTFNGVFLGETHRISHLHTYRGGVFFDQIAADGFVDGLRLEHVAMLGSGEASVGGVAAVNNGVVLRCAVTGILHGSENTVSLGGLVAMNSGIVESCSVDVAICGSQREPPDPTLPTRTPRVGGLIGDNRGGVTECYARGSVSSTGYVGGLVGNNDGSIDASYAAVTVTGPMPDMTGGLVGQMVTRTVLVRGEVRIAVSPTSIADCYFLALADGGGPDNGWGTPLTENQMRQQASFVGWDLETVWTICEGRDYPRLQWEGVECAE